MQKTFQKINIPKLAVLSTEEAIKQIREKINETKDWKNIIDLIPKFYQVKKCKKLV